MQQLTSYISGVWAYGQGKERAIHHAVSGEALYQVCSDGLPLAESLDYARQHGGKALAAMTFQQRAAVLRGCLPMRAWLGVSFPTIPFGLKMN